MADYGAPLCTTNASSSWLSKPQNFSSLYPPRLPHAFLPPLLATDWPYVRPQTYQAHPLKPVTIWSCIVTPKKPPSLPGSRRPSLSIGDRVRSISVYVNDFIGEIINVSESKSSPSVTPSLPPSTSAVLREEHELTITSKSPARISVVDMAVNVVRNRRISRTHTPLHEIHLADLNPGHERREANGNEQQWSPFC